MVNTFLTSSDFAQSAKNLDRARLGKQRVEAYQILNLIQDIKLLAPLLDVKLRSKDLKASILKIFRIVRDLPDFLVIDKNRNVFRIQRTIPIQHITIRVDSNGIETEEIKDMLIQNTFPDPVRLPPQYKIYLNEEGEEVSRETTYFDPIPHDPEPDPKDRVIRLGFANHPAVRMWFWHEMALQAYINAHIDEFVKRGYNNTMVRYEVPDDYVKPHWCFDETFHRNHMSALHHKELDRKEKPWYVNMEHFVSAGQFVDYVWPEDEED